MKGSELTSIAQRIVGVSCILGLIQKEVSKEICITRAVIAKYESVITIFCNTHNVNKDWLLTGNGEVFIKTVALIKESDIGERT